MCVRFGFRMMSLVSAISVSFGSVVLPVPMAMAETINWRNNCDRWEHIPANETLGNPETALLFCTSNEERTWLALQVHCEVETPTMVMRYRPGFEFTPPVTRTDTDDSGDGSDQLSAEDREAAALFAAIPYEDSGIRTLPTSGRGASEMVFMDFQSFGYTNVANFNDAAQEWEFVEKQPLSPVFSRLVSGNYADIKLLAYDKTERFPLRGSSKALRPVIEVCRIAKREADKG